MPAASSPAQALSAVNTAKLAAAETVMQKQLRNQAVATAAREKELVLQIEALKELLAQQKKDTLYFRIKEAKRGCKGCYMF